MKISEEVLLELLNRLFVSAGEKTSISIVQKDGYFEYGFSSDCKTVVGGGKCEESVSISVLYHRVLNHIMSEKARVLRRLEVSEIGK